MRQLLRDAMIKSVIISASVVMIVFAPGNSEVDLKVKINCSDPHVWSTPVGVDHCAVGE